MHEVIIHLLVAGVVILEMVLIPLLAEEVKTLFQPILGAFPDDQGMRHEEYIVLQREHLRKHYMIIPLCGIRVYLPFHLREQDSF